MKKLFLIWFFGLILTNVCYATDVGLAWYDNGSTISGPSSCTVGGTFVPPTPPARPGYRFTGWKAYTCASRIQGLNTSTKGTASGYARLNGNAGENESTYGLTVGSGQWAAQFSYGVVYGMGNCNTTSGKYAVAAEIRTESSGLHCWCQATGFTPYREDNDYTGGPQCTVTPASSSWVFAAGNFITEDYCAYCAYYCTYSVLNRSDFRSVLFGAVGQ